MPMKQRRRIYYTEAQKALMWERWQKSESLQHIAQIFDRNHSSVQGILAETGGIRPAQRHRSRSANRRWKAMRTCFSLSAGAIYVACEYFEIRCCDGAGALNCSPATLPNFRDPR
jgi:hypothetical protein